MKIGDKTDFLKQVYMLVIVANTVLGLSPSLGPAAASLASTPTGSIGTGCPPFSTPHLWRCSAGSLGF
jgi:hypothetical protein